MRIKLRMSESRKTSASVVDAVLPAPILVFGGPHGNLEATETVLGTPRPLSPKATHMRSEHRTYCRVAMFFRPRTWQIECVH